MPQLMFRIPRSSRTLEEWTFTSPNTHSLRRTRSGLQPSVPFPTCTQGVAGVAGVALGLHGDGALPLPMQRTDTSSHHEQVGKPILDSPLLIRLPIPFKRKGPATCVFPEKFQCPRVISLSGWLRVPAVDDFFASNAPPSRGGSE